MENPGNQEDEFSQFLKSGIYRLKNQTAVFLDPVRVLNRSYTRFRVSPSTYYSRFFESSGETKPDHIQPGSDLCSRKRKRKKQKPVLPLNETEQIAQQRHQRARPLLLEAQKNFLQATGLFRFLRTLRTDESVEEESTRKNELDFVQLASIWQAPLYEICLHLEDGDELEPAFNNLVMNGGDNDLEAGILNHGYIMPNDSCFYMSDLQMVHNLIPVESDCGFNLILIDPPWENSSAHQKMKYQTLPNRHFLSLPVKQLTHTSGALVALWVTNREKLRRFVENELFPAWRVKYAATVYWLKIKADGSLIGELDLFHHRPYECLLLGYVSGKDVDLDRLSGRKPLPNNQVLISVPGDYSRKPPVGDMLLDYVPSSGQPRCVELFARELHSGWCSWGNEPLHFQDTKYFSTKRERDEARNRPKKHYSSWKIEKTIEVAVIRSPFFWGCTMQLELLVMVYKFCIGYGCKCCIFF